MNLVTASVFLPLISAIFASVFALKQNNKIVNLFSSSLILLAAIASCYMFYGVVYNNLSYQQLIFRWFDVGDFKISWTVKADILSVIMISVVNIVSAIVHFYSIGYMRHDKNANRFTCYLSLFTFFMLLLVSSNNFLQLFVGWEGVGLCSYLLIGFWYQKDSANRAAVKAFVVNRVGDFAFLIGIIGIYILFGSINFDVVFSQIDIFKDTKLELFSLTFNYLDFICLMLFIGCMGKSAQLFLHVWLPDAMEGPTPVSALIHAATMVTAGVFLLVRCSALFEHSPAILDLVTIIGALTCIFAALIAITQNDIKKVIAYSTCSQLGYMFFACGVSAYGAAMFHLVTHAFFKALLFLGAGAVIIATKHEQDLRNMGGLWKKIPYIYLAMWIGSLAIAGVPPFSGFYSKDMILESAYLSKSEFSSLAYTLGIISVFLTAFYSWRLIYMAFHRKPVQGKRIEKIPHIVNFSLIILIIGSIAAGYVGYHFYHMADSTSAFWQNAIFVSSDNHISHENIHLPIIIKYLPLIITLSGIIAATICYFYPSNIPSSMVNNFHFIYKLFHNKFYFDEFYKKFIIRYYYSISNYFAKNIDKSLIDDLGPNGFSFITKRISRFVSVWQSGYLYHYALAMILGMLFLLLWTLFRII
jgi:NADH-quinone oxidoreductase subunit L